jgi:N-dimethylarginine dimethylaminohydrolase
MHATGVVLADVEQVRDLSVEDIPTRPVHSTVVLVDPAYFDVEYAINPHMGGDVDSERARAQWDQLRDVYEDLADDVRVLDPAETWPSLGDGSDSPPPAERPDMVFVANHAVPSADGDRVVLSRMATAERTGEPDYFGAWADEQGYGVQSPPSFQFEGMGDALWHPGRRLLWGGHGVRSDRQAYDELAARLGATVVPLELTDDRYYHLDVCLAPLSESTALVQPEAFTTDGLAKIRAVFDRVLEAPANESTDGFAVNVEVVDDTVILGSEAPETTALLEDAGYDVRSVATDEFMKAGGSVCCLTLSVGSPASMR